MYAGQLRTPIVIQSRTSVQDAAGQPIHTWAPIQASPVWADFRVNSGLESIKSDAEVSAAKASARIRFRPDLDQTMRVLADGKTWEIKAVLADVNRRRYVDLVLEVVK